MVKRSRRMRSKGTSNSSFCHSVTKKRRLRGGGGEGRRGEGRKAKGRRICRYFFFFRKWKID
jgi:hypothetical protein